jgi:dihydroxyacetone kinase-like predicted kinase
LDRTTYFKSACLFINTKGCFNLQQFGEFRNIKAEKHVRTIKTERTLKNNEAIVAFTPSAGIACFFKNDLNVQAVIDGGQSMNPSTDDFLQAIEEVDAMEVYILPNNSYAILAAQQAAKVEKKSKAYVIPSTSFQEGMVATSSFDLSESSKKKVSTLKNTYCVLTRLFMS